jgi:hypothetical protein
VTKDEAEAARQAWLERTLAEAPPLAPWQIARVVRLMNPGPP